MKWPNTFTQCYVYYTVKLQVDSAWKSVDCPTVSLHEVHLYDTPLKLILDHARWVLLAVLFIQQTFLKYIYSIIKPSSY